MRGSVRPARLLISSALAVGAGLFVPAMAEALTLGQVAPPEKGGCQECVVIQRTTAPGGPSYKVPKGKWTITRWSAQGGGSAAGQARLLVARPTGPPGRFKMHRRSKQETVPADGSPKFETKIRVKRGDRLGLQTVDNLVSGYITGVSRDLVGTVPCEPTPGTAVGAGTSCPVGDLPESLVNVWVKLRRR